MRSLVMAADAQSGAVAGDSANRAIRRPALPELRAIRNGMRATTLVSRRPAIVAVAPMRATRLWRSEHLHAMLKHGEALGAA